MEQMTPHYKSKRLHKQNPPHRIYDSLIENGRCSQNLLWKYLRGPDVCNLAASQEEALVKKNLIYTSRCHSALTFIDASAQNFLSKVNAKKFCARGSEIFRGRVQITSNSAKYSWGLLILLLFIFHIYFII